MSLTTIPYQPLPFDLEENCTLPCSNWMQKIQKSDVTSIQFRYTPCGTTATVIENGDFSGGSSDWTAAPNTWTFTGSEAVSPIASGGSIFQTLPDMGVDYIEVSFDLDLNVGDFIFSYDGNIVDYSGGGAKSIVIPVSGAITLLFGFYDALGGSVSNIIVKPINGNVRIDVLDLNDNVVATAPTNFLSYTDGYFTCVFDWSDLALDDGCYKLAAYDPCECSQFGFVGDNFEVPNQFRVITGTATITGGAMTFDFVGQTQVRSRALLCPDVDYEITYTVTGISAATQDVQVRIGTTNGTVRTTDGTYTETLSTSYTGDIEVRFIANDSGSVSTFEINTFSIEAVEPIITFESVPFSLKETHKCSVLVSACGVGEEFNFGFNGTGFNPVIRLESTYRTANYPTTRTSYEYSTGEKRVPYMRTRKAKTLIFGAAEYVMDWATLWLGLSNVSIDGVAKFCEDDEPPTVSWEDDEDFGIVTFTFSDAIQLTEKTSCVSLPNVGCGGGYFIQVESSGGYAKPLLPVFTTPSNQKILYGI